MEKNNKSILDIGWIIVFVICLLIFIVLIFSCYSITKPTINQKDTTVYNITYKDSIIYNIEYRDSIIYNIKIKESEKIKKADNLTDSAAVELFYKLVTK